MIRLVVLAAVAVTGVPLAGTWSATIAAAPSAQFDGVWKLRFSTNGAYVISKAGQKLVVGKATFKGATVTFHDLSGPASCAGVQAVGSYRWTITGRKLKLKPVREPCSGRRFVLTRTFARIKNAAAA
ncbi:MAG: hypothetical protein ACRDL2_16605 [Gaiellaceae bacterium]